MSEEEEDGEDSSHRAVEETMHALQERRQAKITQRLQEHQQETWGEDEDENEGRER